MARELMTIRLDAGLRARLGVVARRRALTPSAAVRLAVEGWLADEDARAAVRPYDQLLDLIGRVETRRPAASLSGTKTTQLRRRRRARRGSPR